MTKIQACFYASSYETGIVRGRACVHPAVLDTVDVLVWGKTVFHATENDFRFDRLKWRLVRHLETKLRQETRRM